MFTLHDPPSHEEVEEPSLFGGVELPVPTAAVDTEIGGAGRFGERSALALSGWGCSLDEVTGSMELGEEGTPPCSEYAPVGDIPRSPWIRAWPVSYDDGGKFEMEPGRGNTTMFSDLPRWLAVSVSGLCRLWDGF